jgi:WD40 repeat protein
MKTLIAFLLLTTISCAGDVVPVTALTFTPDGRQIVFNTASGLVVRDLDDKASPKLLFELDWPKITDAAFNPSGNYLAVSGGVPGEKGGVLLLDWPSRRVLARWEEGADLITAIAWTHVGNELAVASHDQSVRVFTVGDGTLKQPMTLSGHTRSVFAVAFSPDDTLLVSTGADRTLKVWNADTGKLERTSTPFIRPQHTGNHCASGGADHHIGRMMRIVRHHAIFALAWDPQGNASSPLVRKAQFAPAAISAALARTGFTGSLSVPMANVSLRAAAWRSEGVGSLHPPGHGPMTKTRLHFTRSAPLSARLMNLKPASRIAIRAVVKTVRALWHA